MGWRENMGIIQMVSDIKTYSQYSQYSQIKNTPYQIANIANIANTKSDPRISEFSNRLAELITMADNSRGMTPEQVQSISEEGSRIIEILSHNVVKERKNECRTEKELKG
ncbi:MAG: hypothetical protein HF978_14240 [Desulfobacteraceae bacterium]|nr:hypothetical protein [Desulfobacteraceae bacterium]MBC2756698.1 hypothetical protein [Desulfobacteraceae bacterium]